MENHKKTYHGPLDPMLDIYKLYISRLDDLVCGCNLFFCNTMTLSFALLEPSNRQSNTQNQRPLGGNSVDCHPT